MGPVQVRPVVEDVHLVDPHAVESIGTLLELAEQPDRLAVGDGHDEVGIRREHVDQGLGERGGVARRRWERQHENDVTTGAGAGR
jgi:hypothetical protein